MREGGWAQQELRKTRLDASLDLDESCYYGTIRALTATQTHLYTCSDTSLHHIDSKAPILFLLPLLNSTLPLQYNRYTSPTDPL